jgi:glycosyltransferase 2 family protein
MIHKMSKIKKPLLKILKTPALYIIGIAIIGFILYKIGIKEITVTISSMNLFYLPLIIILTLGALFLGSLSIWILVRPIKEISLRKIIRYYCISWAFGLIAPGKIGDFSILLWFKKKENINFGQGLAVVILDKVITFAILFIFASASLFLFFPFVMALKLFFLVLGIGAVGLIIIYTPWGRRIVRKTILRKHAIYFNGFWTASKNYFSSLQKTLLINIAATLGRVILTGLIYYSIFLSIGLKTNIIYVFLISATVLIISFIPISINGLGIRELTNVYLYSQVGITPQIAFSSSIINLIILYVLGAIIFSYTYKMRNSENDPQSAPDTFPN